MYSSTLNSILLCVTVLAASAAADCWDRKCSIDGLGTFACSYACRRKGYRYSGYETYFKGGWPPRANTVCTCGTYHSENCNTCRTRGTPCRTRKQESDDFYAGRVPKC